jgi:LysM repeat protein
MGYSCSTTLKNGKLKMGNSDKEISDKDFVMSNNYEDEKPLDDDESEAYEPYDEAYAKPSSLPLILTGVGIFVLIILSIMVLSKAQDLAEKEQVLALESKLEKLERKLGDLEQTDGLAGETPENQFNLLNDRMAKLETSITTKIDQMIAELEVLKVTTASKPKTKTEAPQPAKQKQKEIKPTVHKVQAGETLYRIARRYGLTIDQLRKYNKLTPNTKIYPGQELKLTP